MAVASHEIEKLGKPQVAFASKPFLTSFLQQTLALGVDRVPVIVINAETCHPGPVRKQLREVVGLIGYELTERSAARPAEERIHWAPAL